MEPITQKDCKVFLEEIEKKKIDVPKFDLTFLDPPFNQGKDYPSNKDNLKHADYWNWMTEICSSVYSNTSDGGCVYLGF